LDDDEYEDLLEEIRQEAEKYGTVVSMYVPRGTPPLKDEEGHDLPQPRDWSVGKAYIEFKRKEEAKACLNGVVGKRFDGRTIIPGYISEERYANKTFDPDVEEEKKIAEKWKKEQEKREEEAKERENKENKDKRH